MLPEFKQKTKILHKMQFTLKVFVSRGYGIAYSSYKGFSSSLLRRTLGSLSKISEQVDLFAVVFLLYECYNIIFIMKDDVSSVMGAFGNTGT